MFPSQNIKQINKQQSNRFNNQQISLLMLFRFSSIKKISQYVKAQQLFQQKQYDRATQYFATFMSFVNNIPKSQNQQQIISFYHLAIKNQIKRKNYNLVYNYSKNLCQSFPSQFKFFYLTYYLSKQISKSTQKNQTQLKFSPQNTINTQLIEKILDQNKKVSKYQNLSAIQDNQFHLNQLTNIEVLANYLNIQNNLNIFSFSKNINKIENINMVLKNISTILAEKLKISIQNPTSQNIDQIINKIKQFNLYQSLYTFIFLMYDSNSIQNKILTFWTHLLLKYSEKYQSDQLYKPLFLLSMILCDNNQYVSSQGLINAAIDKLNPKFDNQVAFVNLCRARLYDRIEKRQSQAQQIKQKYLPIFDQRKILIDMII